MAKGKITKSAIDEIQTADVEQFLWDVEVRGFGVKVTPKGKKVYVLQYCLGGRAGRTRRFTIGEHGKDGWTPATARKRALELRSDINRGIDPMDARDQRKETPTLKEAFDEYAAEQKRIGGMRRIGSASRKGWKPLTAKMNDRMARLFIVPKLGKRLVTDVTKSDIAGLHRELGDTPRQANNVLQLLSGLFNWLERNGHPHPSPNPVSSIDRYEEHSVERYLTSEELGRLSKALAEYEARAKKLDFPVQLAEAAAIRLAIFTGMRVGEILPLEWDWVDFEKREIRLPDAKAGARTVPLNAPALSVLADVKREEDTKFVFCGSKPGEHLPTLQRAWRKIRVKAEIPDVRLHDLRHSHATFGVTSGAHMRLIGGLLGHRSSRSTERYAHVDTDPLRAASETIGRRIADAMADCG